MILAAYLHEILGLSWGVIDKKMDRGYNTCNTKYCRVPNGLKNAGTKSAMRWPERKRAIDALLRTQDLDMEGMVQYLAKYIETDSLPTTTADEYARLEMLDSNPYAPVSTLHARIVESGSLRTSPLSGSDSVIIETTRKRRGVAEGEIISGRLRPGARLADGQLDLKMLNRRQDTLDSVLVASDQEEKPQETSSAILTQPTALLFDLGAELTDEDECEDLYIQRKRPYLSGPERIFAERAIRLETYDAEIWQGTTLHVDFSASEIVAIVEAVKHIYPELYYPQLWGRLQRMLAPATRAQLAAITAQAAQDQRLRVRTRRSIMGFLLDLVAGIPLLQSKKLKIASIPIAPVSERIAPPHHTLRRELGVSLKKSSKLILRDKIHDTMTVTRTWTGASGDVGNLVWSPLGTYFAAGSACLVDLNSMQYNQPNNLLFGNVDQGMLYELPDHYRLRTKPRQGVNATHSMHTSQDQRLFETVSMVDFSRDGMQMFSVGYDNHLRYYRVDGDRGNCALVASHDHDVKIDLLALHGRQNVLATGCQDLQAGVRVFRYSDDGLWLMHDLFSNKARSMLDKQIRPSALKWGIHPPCRNISWQASRPVPTATSIHKQCMARSACGTWLKA
jgi:hypothetical protein